MLHPIEVSALTNILSSVRNISFEDRWCACANGAAWPPSEILGEYMYVQMYGRRLYIWRIT
jgi:hypothetical protein